MKSPVVTLASILLVTSSLHGQFVTLTFPTTHLPISDRTNAIEDHFREPPQEDRARQSPTRSIALGDSVIDN